MKSENQELARSADESTRKDLPFQEKITKLLFAAIVQQKKRYRASEFPPRNRKKSLASFTAITLNKSHTAATLPHVRRFAYPCKVIPHTERRHIEATVWLLQQGIYYTIIKAVFPIYFSGFSRLLLFTLCGILCTTEAENRTENHEFWRKNR